MEVKINESYASEVYEIASLLDIDPEIDKRHLWIAEQCLLHPFAGLSEIHSWSEQTDNNGFIFFYNTKTNISTWTPPSIPHYKSLLLQLKSRTNKIHKNTKVRKSTAVTWDAKSLSNEINKQNFINNLPIGNNKLSLKNKQSTWSA